MTREIKHYILIYRKPHILTYGSHQTTGTLQLLPHKQNFLNISYTSIEPSYDLSSDLSPVIATISTSPIYIPPTPRLHNSWTNWNDYRTKLHDDINLHISLKSCTEVEATNNYWSITRCSTTSHFNNTL
jgi:hypothetical protein